MSIFSPTLFFSTTNPKVRVSLPPTSTSTSSAALLRCRGGLRRYPCFAVSGAAAESVRDEKVAAVGTELGYERSAFIDARSEK
nr:glycerol-3-phosphate O-acyltransferase, alpha helical bundle, N-terminal [Tanacetum cinerariifolium]